MSHRRKRRPWDDGSDDDPGAGLLNLFDVWIAFAVALLLAIVSYQSRLHTDGENQAPGLEALDTQGTPLKHYHPSEESAGGDGERLGTAYRLKSGEVIYVPEKPVEKPAAQAARVALDPSLRPKGG